MTLHDPARFTRAADHITAWLDKSCADYPTLHHLAHIPVRRPHDPTRRSGPADPTGNAATDPRAAHAHTEALAASGLLDKIFRLTQTLDETVGRGLTAADPPHHNDPHTPAAWHDRIPTGRPDLKAAHLKQATRMTIHQLRHHLATSHAHPNSRDLGHGQLILAHNHTHNPPTTPKKRR